MKLFNLRLLSFFFLLGLFATSCTPDSTTLEEVVEEVEIGMEGTIGNRSVTTDAFALFCEASNGAIVVNLSNNIDLVSDELDFTNVSSGDFLLFFSTVDDSEFAAGGTFLTMADDGVPIDQLVIGDTELVLDTYTETTVSGSFSGELFVFDAEGPTGETVPYEFTFTAEIIGESNICG